MSENHQPFQLTQALLQQAIQVMGRAFYDDPFLNYLVPDGSKRARLTPEFVGIVVNYCFRYGEVWTLPALDAVGCWLTPGKTSPTPYIGSLLPNLIGIFGGWGLSRSAKGVD